MSNDYQIAYLERKKQKLLDSINPPHEEIIGKEIISKPEDFEKKYGSIQKG
jgi:hypothetical protein